MIDVICVVGHSPTRPGARNWSRDVYEYEFNKPLVERVAARLSDAGIAATAESYRGTGNVARWSGASRLLVEFHCNAFKPNAASGTAVVCSAAPASISAAQALAGALAVALRLPLRANRGALVVLPDPGVVEGGRDRHGIGGGYLIYGCRQPAFVAEPFFIDNDEDLAAAESADLAGAYVAGIADMLRVLP